MVTGKIFRSNKEFIYRERVFYEIKAYSRSKINRSTNVVELNRRLVFFVMYETS